MEKKFYLHELEELILRWQYFPSNQQIWCNCYQNGKADTKIYIKLLGTLKSLNNLKQNWKKISILDFKIYNKALIIKKKYGTGIRLDV